MDLESFPGRRGGEFAVDIALLDEERLVFELRRLAVMHEQHPER